MAPLPIPAEREVRILESRDHLRIGDDLAVHNEVGNQRDYERALGLGSDFLTADDADDADIADIADIADREFYQWLVPLSLDPVDLVRSKVVLDHR